MASAAVATTTGFNMFSSKERFNVLRSRRPPPPRLKLKFGQVGSASS
jgi:hypothetical protein